MRADKLVCTLSSLRGMMSTTKDKYSIENTDYTVGQDNVQKWGFDVHNPVFGTSAGLIIVFFNRTSFSRSCHSKSRS